MPTNDKDKPLPNAREFNRFLPNSTSKSRPALAVDTTFIQHDVRVPQQVYPTSSLSRTLESVSSLNEIKAKRLPEPPKSNQVVKGQLGNNAQLRQGPQKPVTGSYTQLGQVLKSARAPVNETPPPYTARNASKTDVSRQPAPFVLQDPPKAKRRNNELRRPTSLKLGSAISPSDRNIEIGLAISSAAIQDHAHRLESEASQAQTFPWRQSSRRSCQSLKTPTIVVTPAEEDFEAYLKTLPQEFPQTTGYRPRSSVYSRYTNCLPKGTRHERTPPVPPLPAFAMESRSTARSGETAYSDLTCSKQSSSLFPSSRRDDRAISVCTAFNEDSPVALASATSLQSNRMSSQSRLATPRRSRGWWSILVSPFSAASASRTFFQSSSPVAEEEQHRTRLLNGSTLERSPSDDTLFTSRSLGDNDLRSAPPTKCSRQTFENRRVRTPKRSDTAPGALDLGHAGTVNIYRTPSKGAASSYFDQKRSYPSLGAPMASADLDRGVGEDWSPSQSVYRGSRGFSPSSFKNEDGGFANIPIPTEGEAARYYDTTRHFPSTYKPGSGESLPRGGFGSVTSGDQPFVQSPSDDAHPRGDEYMGRNDNPRALEQQTPGFPDGGAATYSKRDTSPMKNRPSAKYTEEYGQSPREAAMATDAGIYPSSFGNTSGSQSTGISDPSQTSTSTREARRISLASSSDLAEPFERSASPQSQSPVLEHAQCARYVGSPPRHGNPRGVHFASDQEETGFDVTQRNDSKSRFATSDIDEDSGHEDLPATPGPLNEKRNFETLHSGRFQNRDLEGTSGPARSWYRKTLGLIATFVVLLLVLAIVLVVMFVPVHHADMPVQAQWLNLTGFPPLPTGVATVVGAKSVKDLASCVTHEALWSCAAPPGEGLITTQPDQPNFRFLIRFRNGTLSNETLLQPASNLTIRRDSGRAANAGALVKRSAWSSYLYTSSPPPPSTEDQIFLGRTSDGVSSPYDGEETPFYISLLNPVPLQPVKRSILKKRSFRYPYPTSADSNSHSSHSASGVSSLTPTASDKAAAPIPPPAVRGSGEPAPPELYPYAYALPLRLFNRGQPSEHYGFYTYFDRSIYVSSSVSDTSANSSSATGDRTFGNVRLDDASAVCTWAQSRLLVQIWTGKPDVTELMPISNASSIPAVNSTANDMKSPGSFPYAVTVTLDRHGGDASKKGVYCYDLDENHRVLESVGTWITENRAVGGKIINPAGIPTSNGTLLNQRDVGRGGGIDGGTSGCSCQWQNFN